MYPEIPNVSHCFCPSKLLLRHCVYQEGGVHSLITHSLTHSRVPGECLVHESGPRLAPGGSSGQGLGCSAQGLRWPLMRWRLLLVVLREVLLLEGTPAAGGKAPGGVPHRDHRTMLRWNISGFCTIRLVVSEEALEGFSLVFLDFLLIQTAF